MKSLKFTIAFSFLFLSFFNFSQSNTLVVFSQDPTPFYIVLDGVKKNEVAETRVVVPGIRQTNSNVQIFFKDESMSPEIFHLPVKAPFLGCVANRISLRTMIY